MRRGTAGQVLGTLIATAAIWLSLAPVASAGPILDWLFPGLAARREARRAYWSVPGTTTYHVPVSSYYGGYPAWNAGAITPASAAYSPTTAYRTVWAPVPVTSYSPVTYVNPLATGTVSDVQACTTYQWQARRVPYISYMPSTTVAPVAAPVTYAMPSSVTTNYGAAVSYSAPVQTLAPVQTVAPATYAAPATNYAPAPGAYAPATSASDCGYANGAAFAPSTAPSYTAPSYTAPQNGTTIYGDTYNPPATGGAAQPGSVPADQPPSLRPFGSQEQQPSPPATGSQQGQTPQQGPSSERQLQYSPPSKDAGARMVPIPDLDAQVNPPLPLRLNPAMPAVATSPTAASAAPASGQTPHLDAVQPIPELERQRQVWERERAPRLFDAQDHSAQRSAPPELPEFTAWEAVPVRWAVMTPEDQTTRVAPIGTELPHNGVPTPTIAPARADEHVWRPVTTE